MDNGYYVVTVGVLGEIWSLIRKEENINNIVVLLKSYVVILSNK